MIPQIMLFHTATMVSALLLVVFAAGLHPAAAAAARVRQPAARGSPSTGLLLVAVDPADGRWPDHRVRLRRRRARPDRARGRASFFGHWIGTIPWLWGTAGLTGLVVGVAALRHRALRAVDRV